MRKYLIPILVGAAFVATGGAASAEEGDYLGNFEGFYAGVLTGFTPASNNNRYQVGVLGGYRMKLSNYLILGAEVQASVGLDTFFSQYVGGIISGQAGFVVGDNILLYAKAGFGAEKYNFITSPATYFPVVGFGAELAVNEYVNLRFEGLAELTNPYDPVRPVRGAEFNFGVIANFD